MQDALSARNQQIKQLSEANVKRVSDLRQKKMQTVFEKVNVFIGEYGKKKHYSMILDSHRRKYTFSATREVFDITEDIIKGLNERTNKAVLIACIALQFLNCGDKLPAKEYMQYFERNHSRFTKTVEAERCDPETYRTYLVDFLAARENCGWGQRIGRKCTSQYSNTILITVG